MDSYSVAGVEEQVIVLNIDEHAITKKVCEDRSIKPLVHNIL